MPASSSLMQSRRPLLFRTLNGLGSLLEKAGLLNLRTSEESLLSAARRRTGLSDFGDENFREPLRRLLASIDTEARLNTVGRLAVREEFLQLLINRLHIERDRAAYPEISHQAIEKPIFIIGLPRTGTTLLHSLLGLDPQYRTPLTWEVMFPSPPTGDETSERIRKTEKILAHLDQLAPDFKAIHLTGAELPQECVPIMSHTFMSDEFDGLFNVPAYRTWFEQQDARPVYEYHRRFLQHLQYAQPARRWVLKAPAHILAPRALLSVYPDAQIVQTHREPLDVLASNASLNTVLRAIFSDFVDPALIGREMSDFWSAALDNFARLREEHPPGQFFDLHYTEILKDPIGAIHRLYAHFGNSLSAETEQRMRGFLEKNPKDKHGPHRYTLAEFGLDASAESPRFQCYRERFNLTAPATPVHACPTAK